MKEGALTGATNEEEEQEEGEEEEEEEEGEEDQGTKVGGEGGRKSPTGDWNPGRNPRCC